MLLRTRSSNFVCSDLNGNTEWYFDPVEKSYSRLTSAGVVMTTIVGRDLADPDTIRETGREPTASTVKLWNHWKEHR
jgi:hypothetical protein